MTTETLLEGGQIADHSDGREAVLKLRGVRTQFGSQVVHNHLDFDMFRGEIVGLVGGSGTGKSVLLRTIIGLNQARRGKIEVLGIDTRSLHGKTERDLQSRTGVQFQDGALFSSLTVAENIIVPIREHAALDEEMMRAIAALRQNLGLSVLMVTHDLDSLYAVCDRVAVLLDKRVVAGTIDELLAYDHPWVQEYFRGPRGRAAARQESNGSNG